MNKTLYTAMTTWQGPYDSESVVYLAGITQKIYKNLKLEFYSKYIIYFLQI